jgi:hypothetical protein
MANHKIGGYQTAEALSSTDTEKITDAVYVSTEDNTITLSDGRIAVVRVAIGKDSYGFNTLTDGDVQRQMAAMLQTCCQVDGKMLFMEDYESLKLADYAKVSQLFRSVNLL